ncbi:MULTISPECIES: Fur family transcriptional regulator [Exiguobacterium]|jgi:Fur family zinc uptake transcriptional regulator|uniref:Fur family transcriptional regulator n=2 Tax=Exiguobacterium TaxID=33986 RepID=U1M0C1_9BACL|nr:MULTISPECIES: Fur family transcriptional regulator [Exiguobacterium]ERG68449.1 Fur family transcriptional regulator [Exiguobacterium chiriqhucha RW-2]KAB2861862.1 MAG: transcriptional repressor [Exiguobacterium chiriqhucha]MDL5377374.1 Fur family transcriptional regulator [Exiguobacterium mexicanum]RHB51831.1 transcriptional repressor [Exiguobacterium sp. AM39-5BH]TCI72625.1 transcriptional repressor [Exiguobacterium sp. IPCI3]
MKETEQLTRLQSSSLKVTPKRIEMFAFLAAEERYVSAKDVLDYMRAKHPTMSFDTVYRNLKSFAEEGLLEATELNGEKAFRVTCGSNHHHHHLICRGCGKTKLLELCPMRYVETLDPDFEVVDHKFEIYGYCKQCK